MEQPTGVVEQPAEVAVQPRRRPSIIVQVLEIIAMLLMVFVCYGLLRAFVVGTYEIPSSSMESTINVGDRVFAEKISYYTRSPEPGEVVTFYDPREPSRTLIKRCIAVGGQTVDLIDGRVYVDGVALDEPYTQGKQSVPLQPAAGQVIDYPYTVPTGTIWVMGDNRTNSTDSRYFGAVPLELVTGHANFTYWPIEHFGPLE